MKRLVIGLIVVLLLSGCQTSAQRLTEEQSLCGSGLPGEWRAAPAPADAATLRALGRANTTFPRAGPKFFDQMAWEGWFVSTEGKVLLCVADHKPRESCVGEWWTFDMTTAPPKITNSDGWICVT